MSVLTRDTPRTSELGNCHRRPLAAGECVFLGAALGLTTTGFARPLRAGDAFAGFAEEAADNAAGTDGAVSVSATASDRIVLSVPGFAPADVFKTVHAVDDNTFTLTQSGNSPIGRAVRFEAPGLAVVEYDVAHAA